MHVNDPAAGSAGDGAHEAEAGGTVDALLRLVPNSGVHSAGSVRSSVFGSGDLTGTFGRAVALSAVMHAVLVGLMGVPHAGTPAAVRRAQPNALHVRLQAPPRPADDSPAAPVPVLPKPDVPDTALRPLPAQSASAAQPPEPGVAAGVIAPSGPVLAPVTARYYLPREVDQPSEPLEHAQLFYPEEALKQRIRGVVVMHLFIGADGTLDRTEVVRAEPPGVFEQAVRDAAQASRFRPALLGRVAVNSRITIEVPFDPDCSDFMTCAPASGRK